MPASQSDAPNTPSITIQPGMQRVDPTDHDQMQLPDDQPGILLHVCEARAPTAHADEEQYNMR
jgi:hypothetical protein